jgi:hypothetical protein
MHALWPAGSVLETRRIGSQGAAPALRFIGSAAHTCITTMIGGAGPPWAATSLFVVLRLSKNLKAGKTNANFHRPRDQCTHM